MSEIDVPREDAQAANDLRRDIRRRALVQSALVSALILPLLALGIVTARGPTAPRGAQGTRTTPWEFACPQVTVRGICPVCSGNACTDSYCNFGISNPCASSSGEGWMASAAFVILIIFGIFFAVRRTTHVVALVALVGVTAVSVLRAVTVSTSLARLISTRTSAPDVFRVEPIYLSADIIIAVVAGVTLVAALWWRLKEHQTILIDRAAA